MTTLSTTMRDKRKSLVDRAGAIARPAADANRCLTDAENDEFRSLMAEIDEIDAGRASETKRSQIGEFLADPATFRTSEVPSLLPDARALTELFAAVEGRTSTRVEARATVTSALTGADQLAVQLQNRGFAPRRIAEAASLAVDDDAGITAAEFPVFGSDQAAIAAEGALKAEFDSVTPGSATPQMIAIWSDVTRQNLLTMTNFEAKLRSIFASRVARREDLLLVATITGTTGILNPVGALTADLVLDAAAQIAAGDAGQAPNLVAINPADAPTLLGTTVGTGGTASPPFSAFLPSIHGMQVYPTDHVAAGEAVLGAFPAGARLVVGLRPQFFVDAVSQVKNNLVTILLEEAVALAVDVPGAFAHITAV